MIISYKIRIYPNKTQILKCEKMFGGCRFIYNHYLSYNNNLYKNEEKIVGWRDYRKEIKKMRETDQPWLKELNKHSLDYSAKRCNDAFQRFFSKKSGYPKFKSKKSPVQSFYLDTGDNILFYHNHVKIPYLGKIRITENNYVPKNHHIYGISIKKEIDKYFVIFRVSIDKKELDKSDRPNIKKYGYGIDVGVKSFLTIVDTHGNIFQFDSFLNDKRIVKLEEKIKYLQQKISNKMEINYGKLLNDYLTYHEGNEPNIIQKNIMKGKSYSNSCRYLQNKINKLQWQITNIKNDRINKAVKNMVKIKPEYITVETLSISDMLKNDSSRSLHDYIQKSKFYSFFEKLKIKSYIYNIELRFANKYFASSKKCSYCGNKKKDLKLTDRIYTCKNPACKLFNVTVDRDVNASINLVRLKKYTIYNY